MVGDQNSFYDAHTYHPPKRKYNKEEHRHVSCTINQGDENAMERG